MNYLKAILFILLINAGSAFAQTKVTMPNIITPNDDGVNDVFRISTEGFDELTCTIYNRSGEVVYRFYGINGSWDGYTHAGVKVSAGVYFVYLEVGASDGTSETRQGTLEVLY